MLADELNHWKQLEVDSRKPLSECAHPDDCPHLTIKGVAWAIPRRGLKLVPTFGDDGATLAVQGGDDWPDAERVRELMPVASTEQCPQCGQAVTSELAVDVEKDLEFLRTCYTLAGQLLDRQYTLTNDQKTQMLTMDVGSLPRWVVDLCLWASDAAHPDE